MDFEKLEEINKGLKTTDIKGKDYVEVNTRVLAFRKLYPEGNIETNILSLENGIVVIKADIYDENGKHLSSGIAYEKEGSTFINKTSYIENCETSSIGRALGMLGIGIGTSIASAEEVGNAIVQQEQDNTISETQAKALREEIKDKKIESDLITTTLKQEYNIEKLTEIKVKDLMEFRKKVGLE